jgi:hypothetical protein
MTASNPLQDTKLRDSASYYITYLLSLTSALLLTRDAATDADFLRDGTVGVLFQIKETFNITQYADPV